MTKEAAAAHVLVEGRVQGVGFRFFVQRAASVGKLQGWVRNLPGGNVECEVEGSRAAIESFLEELRKGPSMSRVNDVRVDWRAHVGQFTDFEIR